MVDKDSVQVEDKAQLYLHCDRRDNRRHRWHLNVMDKFEKQ